MKDIDGFTACSSLKSINLPEGLETIGIQAFCDCDSLKTVTIPSSVNSIGFGAFEWCDSLTEIKVKSNNAYFTDINGVLYNKDKTKILQYPKAKTQTSYIIPSSVTTVGRDAFEECENLKSIILPKRLTSIEESAFSSSGIKTIEIPAGVTTISRSAFNSSLIESIVLPNNIVKIDEMAFRNCKNLKKYLFRILNVKLMIALVLYAVIWLLRMHIDNSTVLFTAMKILQPMLMHKNMNILFQPLFMVTLTVTVSLQPVMPHL